MYNCVSVAGALFYPLLLVASCPIGRREEENNYFLLNLYGIKANLFWKHARWENPGAPKVWEEGTSFPRAEERHCEACWEVIILVKEYFC